MQLLLLLLIKSPSEHFFDLFFCPAPDVNIWMLDVHIFQSTKKPRITLRHPAVTLKCCLSSLDFRDILKMETYGLS
jgi:hypothetical protein